MHEAQAAVREPQGNLLTRNDTMLGICEGLGEDLGFNPNWLRVALGAGLLWNPAAVIGIYLGLGLVVLASRLLFPRSRKAAANVHPQPATAAAPVSSAEEPHREEERELIAA